MPDWGEDFDSSLCEFIEADARSDYYLCASPGFISTSRLAVKRIGPLRLTMIPSIDSAFFNRIVGLGVTEPATEALLDDAIDQLSQAGCKNFMVPLSPNAQPSQLHEWLTARGCSKGRNWGKAVRGDDPPILIPTSLRVEEIGREYADAFSDIILPVFSMPEVLHPLMSAHVGVGSPRWRNYLAFDGDVPVSAASMFIQGENAWLGFGATLPSHRKRGGQGALLARRIRDGLARGCKRFFTEADEGTAEAPNPSYNNIIRSGFKVVYLRCNYMHQYQ
jgi:hypothetical protein